MKRAVYFSIALLAALSWTQPVAGATDSKAVYGRPEHYLTSQLAYSDFSIRFDKREEHRPAGTNLLGITYTIDVLDKKGGKISGFRLTMSGIFENTASFEVGGKTFVAEMFYSTAGQPAIRETPPKQDGWLPHNEIVVWDETSARNGNPQLVHFWTTKEANHPPDPTSQSGAPPASAVGAPSVAADH